MPIEVGIWKLGENLQRIKISSMDSESKLEDYLCEDLSILSPDLMLIGRQIPTDFGKYIDILAMDAEGNLTVVELKRNRTPREVVAQILDYASWVQNLSHNEITDIYSEMNSGQAFEEGFAKVFDSSPPENLNESHNLIIVAAELDPATERIIGYLSDNYGVPINAVFFQCFKEGESEFLTRTWLIDPQEAEIKTSKSLRKKEKETWNGRDFYVNFGDNSKESEGLYRSWEDARQYGFVSAGGKRWFSMSMENLFPGARVFVNIPKYGYVGVGEVTESACPVNEFLVDHDDQKVRLLDAPLTVKEPQRMAENADDPEKRELFVRVKWIKTVPKQDAFWEKGMFAIQLSACKLRNRFTLERLTQHFNLNE